MRYFFDVFDTIDAVDEEGLDLESDAEALAFAQQSARDLAAVEVRSGSLHLCHCIVVRDEQGRRVASIRFGDVVEVIR